MPSRVSRSLGGMAAAFWLAALAILPGAAWADSAVAVWRHQAETGAREVYVNDASGQHVSSVARPFETERQQRRMDELALASERHQAWQRWTMTVLGGSIVLVGLLAFLAYQRRTHGMLMESHRQLQESQSMLRALTERNETIREAERKRIAREIHDELGQMLNVMRLKVLACNYQFGADHPFLQESSMDLLQTLDRTIAMIRDIVSALHPSVLNAGIVGALDWLTQEFSKNTGIACNLWVEDKVVLDEAQVTAIFRIVQESLTNVLKHADADLAEISLTLPDNGNAYLLEIADNGKGFDPRQPRNQKSLGLIGMQERAIMLGGSINIFSKPQQGTVLQVLIPANREIFSGEVS